MDSSAPLEGMSAGLSIPGQCFHTLTGVNCLISLTRFSTNCRHSLSCPFIQNKATLESVKQVGGSSSSSTISAALTLASSLDNSRAPNSSSLGMLCSCNGENPGPGSYKLSSSSSRSLHPKVHNCSVSVCRCVTETL